MTSADPVGSLFKEHGLCFLNFFSENAVTLCAVFLVKAETCR